MGRPSGGASDRGEHERDEGQQADSGEDRAADEPQAVARIAPVEHDPCCGEDRVQRRCRGGDVPEREDRDRQRERQSEARVEPAREAGEDHEQRDELRRPERQDGGSERRRDHPECDGSHAACVAPRRSDRLLADGFLPGALLPLLRRARGVAKLGGEVGGARPCARIERKSGVDGVREPPRQATPFGCEGRRAGLDRARDLLDRNAPEGMPVGERLPEDDSDRPDVALCGRLRAREALGCDVRERSGDVADGSEGVRAVELGEAEVEQPDGDPFVDPRAGCWRASRRDGRSRHGVRAPGRREPAPSISIASRSVSAPARMASRIVRPGTYSYAM